MELSQSQEMARSLSADFVQIGLHGGKGGLLQIFLDDYRICMDDRYALYVSEPVADASRHATDDESIHCFERRKVSTETGVGIQEPMSRGGEFGDPFEDWLGIKTGDKRDPMLLCTPELSVLV